MRTLFQPVALVLLVAALVPGTALAHRNWLYPSLTLVEMHDPWVTIDAANSENLFDLDNVAMKLDGLAVAGPKGPVAPENVFSGHTRSSFDLHLTAPGSYKVSVVQKTSFGSYKLGGEIKRVRGTAETIAAQMPAGATELKMSDTESRLDTFVSTGKLDTAALKVSGHGLEYEPVSHPNDLRAGENARLRFLVDGKPAANLAFSLVPGGVRHRGVLGEIRLSTDANGEANFKLPEAGMYWLNASYPAGQPSPDAPPPRRLQYGATLEVLAQ